MSFVDPAEHLPRLLPVAVALAALPGFEVLWLVAVLRVFAQLVVPFVLLVFDRS